MLPAGWRVVVGLSGLGAILAPARIAVAAQGPEAGEVLPVPYLAQSTLLCGGAAVAMVERWWGTRGVFAEEFSHLVRREEGGIRTTDLAAAARDRGWQVRSLRGTAAIVRQSLAERVPVIALIEVARNRYHYVVLTGWNDSVVTYHDPAVAPNVTLPPARFLDRWHAADQWAMVILPPAAPAPAAPSPPPPSSLPCPPWLDRAAAAASNDRLVAARMALAEAERSCPAEAMVIREQAGIAFREGNHARARQLASEYLQQVPDDTLAWQLLATVRYLLGDRAGALTAWNRIDQATVDLLRISGRRHTRFRVIADATGIPLGMPLTPSAMALGSRRLDDVPALGATRLAYAPIPGGMVEVQAAVVEQPRWPAPPRLLLVGIRAAAGGVAAIDLGSTIGAGERWQARWRWRSANPELGLALELPVRIGPPGVMRVAGSWEQWHFERDIADQRRRAATVDLHHWWTGAVETRLGARHERWRDGPQALAIGAGIGLHGWRDQVALVAEAELAATWDDHPGYRRAAVTLAWQSDAEPFTMVFSARSGVAMSSGDTPLGLRPVAGSNAGRAVPLRAHQWDHDGRLSLDRIGARLVHGGVAVDRELTFAGPFVIGAGAFVDLAGVIRPQSGIASQRWYVDAGAGLQVSLPGSGGSSLRIDLARGLAADPRWGLSVGLAHRWPPRVDGID